jgi:hypothetical protein
MATDPEPAFGSGNVVEHRRNEGRVPTLKSRIEVRSHVRLIAEMSRGVPPSKF